MKSRALPLLILAALVVSCAPPSSSEPPKLEMQEGENVALDDMHLAALQLRSLFEPLDSKALAAHRNSGDTSVKLHAAWELAKGDPVKAKQFIQELEALAKATPPIWWQRCLMSIKVYEGNCHYVPNVEMGDFEKEVRHSQGGYVITCQPGIAGFPYTVTAKNSYAANEEVEMTVWAAGRMFLAGAGVHQMEMGVSDGKLFVFGAESHGVYAEVFRLADGKPLLRFSSCYWFNFSETWKKAVQD